MAIIVVTNGYITVNAVNLSDHLVSARVNDGQETREVTAMGNTQRLFRPGLGTPSIEATWRNDHASGSVEATLRGLISVTSTGFLVEVRKVNSASTTSNPTYSMQSVVDGDLNVIDVEVGESDQVTARFLPYSTFTVSTTSTS